MGQRDSSKTRVIPVFDHLIEKDKTGKSWLPRLLRLNSGGNSTALPKNCDFSIQEIGYGLHEKMLDPPASLLSWIIRNPRKPVSGKISSDPVKEKKRLEWMNGSESTILEALALLRNNPNGEDWFIFEGKTQPDVFIKTPDLILVIEGKRTERKPTTSTKWMAGRHQMIRHIDCAWEIKGRRQVIGFFIVEGDGPQGDMPPAWLDYARNTVTPASIDSSLPHRGPEERRSIASCFAGITTWQRICREFEIDFDQLIDKVYD